MPVSNLIAGPTSRLNNGERPVSPASPKTGHVKVGWHAGRQVFLEGLQALDWPLVGHCGGANRGSGAARHVSRDRKTSPRHG